MKPDFTKAGRPSKLSAEERMKLEKILRKRDDWATKEERNLILEKFGVHYSLRNIMKILRSFGMKYCKPTLETTEGRRTRKKGWKEGLGKP